MGAASKCLQGEVTLSHPGPGGRGAFTEGKWEACLWGRGAVLLGVRSSTQDYLPALIWSSWPLSPSHTRAAEADRHVQSPPRPQPVMASGEFPLKGQRQVCIHPGPGAESRCMRSTVGVGVWQSALGGGLPGLSSCSATLANVSHWPWGSRPTPQTVHCLRSSWSTPFSQSPRRASDVPRIPGPSPGPAQHLWNRLPIQEAAPRNPSLPQDSTGRPGPSMVPPIKHRCSHSLPSGPVSNRASGDQRHLTRDDICYKEKAFDLVGHTFRSE